MVEFIPIDMNVHKSIITKLNEEYFNWVATQFSEKYDLDIFSILKQNVQKYAENSVAELEFYVPPDGICYLIQMSGKIAGMGAIRKLHEEIGEIKRMYIRPEFRGNGLGRELLQQLLKDSKELGFSTIRLDTVRFMIMAQNLYRSAGFIEREEYPESEIPSHLRHMWLFFEKSG